MTLNQVLIYVILALIVGSTYAIYYYSNNLFDKDVTKEQFVKSMLLLFIASTVLAPLIIIETFIKDVKGLLLDFGRYIKKLKERRKTHE